MPAFVALLRGVNVGGAKRVPMADWRALMAGLGYTRVTTLLNSGNAVFHAAGKGQAKKHAQAIAEGLAMHLKVEVPVIVKSANELAAIVAGNTLARDAAAEPGFDPARLLVAFAPDAAALAGLSAVAALVRPPEQFLLGSHAAYLHCAGGILESKAGAALLGKAGRAATTRNWATTLKLLALVG
ncbi:MAG: DUF1697 domain-containing protein [Burkholderiales bacterium]|nr:DUF1697 domain-containing protein [Burkholderiales bacterium]